MPGSPDIASTLPSPFASLATTDVGGDSTDALPHRRAEMTEIRGAATTR